jgi:hypothetical protein
MRAVWKILLLFTLSYCASTYAFALVLKNDSLSSQYKQEDKASSDKKINALHSKLKNGLLNLGTSKMN